MKTLTLCALVLLVGCLGTGTGNPVDPVDGGQDSAGNDGATPDAGPTYDASPFMDSGLPGDASPTDAGSDGGGACTDPTLVCGREPTLGCDCLAGEILELSTSDAPAPPRVIALVDNGAGALIVTEQACVDCEAGYRLEAVLVDELDLATTTPIADSAGATVAVRTDELLRLVWLGADGSLMSGTLGLLDGALTEPAAPVHSPGVVIYGLDVAARGETLAIAYMTPTSANPADGSALSVVVPSDADPVAVQVVSGDVRAMSIAAAADGWMLLWADDVAVHSQPLSPEGALAGEATTIASSLSVERVELIASAAGYVAGFDGTSGALHALDATGASTSESPFAGTLEALALDEEGVMVVSRDCAEATPSLLYRRFDAALSPLHAFILVGEGERGAAVALVGTRHRVAFTSVPATASVVSLTDVCVPPL